MKGGISIYINGRRVVEAFDIYATAGGANRAVDLVFNGIRPRNGVIDIRFLGVTAWDAMVQAVEIAPGAGGEGATPQSLR